MNRWSHTKLTRKTQRVFFNLKLLPLIFTVFAASILLTNHAIAENGTATDSSSVSLAVQEIISLRLLDSTATFPTSSISFDMTPTPNGVFDKKSIIAEAATSNSTGYKLYLTSSGKDHSENYTNSLINIDSPGSEESNLIPSLTTGTSITETDFKRANSPYKNRWGYSTNNLVIPSETVEGSTINTITENAALSNIIYNDIPENNINRQIDDKLEATDHGLTPVTVGVNASSGVTAGTYKNTLELTAIANPQKLDFILNFNGNATDTVENIPSPMAVSSMAAQASFVIPDITPTRSDYVFSGWNTKADGSGSNYGTGDTFTIIADDTPGAGTEKTLYAMWEEKLYTYRVSYSCYPSGTNCPASESIMAGGTLRYTVPSNIPTKTGYTFMGYYTDNHYDYNTYQPGDTITIEYGSYLLNEGEPNEYNHMSLNATWSSTFTLGGLTWTGPMIKYSTYADAASYCPTGYRLPTLSEVESVIGPMADDPPYTVGTNTANMTTLYNKWYTNSRAYYIWTSTQDTASVMYGIYLKTENKIHIIPLPKTLKVSSVICVK